MSNTAGTTSLFHEFRKQELSDRENEMKIKINSDEKERIFKKVSDAHAGVLVEMKSPNDKTSWVVNVPDGCEIESYDIKDGKVIVIFDCQNDKFPKSWEEFCENNPLKQDEISISPGRKSEPKRVRKSGFVNLYRGGILQGINCGYKVFSSEQEARDIFDMTADCEKFAVGKIEWEEAK